MGSDKALLDLGAGTLLGRAVQELGAVCDRVLLACGSEPRYAGLGLPLVLDRAPGLGPLAGLEAGLRAAAERGDGWLVCLPCDMPRADAALLKRLLERAERDDLDACLLSSSRGVEPLCAVYHTRLAQSARAALDQGDRKMTSLLGRPLQDGRAPRVACADAAELGRADACANLNTPADLQAARAAEGAA
jgi:molybdopterin-guanine dinucleotide biosynthesis protein A